MTHFLVAGCDENQRPYVTKVLKELYTSCNITFLSLANDIPSIELKVATLVIVFKDPAQQEFSLPVLPNKLPPVIFVTSTEQEGLDAINQGADDYLLQADIHTHFTSTIKKVLARKTHQDVHTILPHFENNTIGAFELILSSLYEVVWLRTADDLNLLYINNACKLLFGYSHEELVGDQSFFMSRVHPEDRDRYQDTLYLMKQSGYILEYEYRFLHKDGSWKYFKGKGGLLKGYSGAGDLLTGITIDVTKLVTSENMLKEKTQELLDILESINDCFYTVDENWNFTYVNNALEEFYNIRREDLIGRNLWETFPLLKGTEFDEKYHYAARERKWVAFEAYSPNVNKWIYASAYPRNNGLTIFFKDISARKVLEQKVVTDRQNLLSIINATSDVIWSVDKDLNILVANQAFWDAAVKTNGKTREELGDKITADAYGKEAVEYWKTVYEKGFQGESFKVVEMFNSLFGVNFSEISMNPIRDLDNNVVGLSCFSRDITQMRQHLTKIEQQNQKMREIAWIQSHKVRGPVSTILGLVELFNMGDPDSDVNQKILEGIKETTEYLDVVIREIVNKAKEIE